MNCEKCGDELNGDIAYDLVLKNSSLHPQPAVFKLCYRCGGMILSEITKYQIEREQKKRKRG